MKPYTRKVKRSRRVYFALDGGGVVDKHRQDEEIEGTLQQSRPEASSKASRCFPPESIAEPQTMIR